MRIQIAIPLALAWIAACGAEAPPQESAAAEDTTGDTAVPEAETASLPGYLALDENPSAGDILPMPFQVIWEPWQGDFDGMVERRVIRAVVPFGGYQFYYVDGLPK
jgi:hypothetical protein